MLQRLERPLPAGWNQQRRRCMADETRPTVTFDATAAAPEW